MFVFNKLVKSSVNFYFNNYNKMIAIDLSKQQELDAHLKAIQQINFTWNLDRRAGATFFLIEEVKETILDFSQGTVKYCECIPQLYFVLI